MTFGGPGVARNDPQFMAAYIVNHILGGGSFSSRLYREVREKRGLAYGVSNSLVWFRHAAIVLGGTATRADATADALAVIEQETRRMAESGPTAEELAAAKSFLKGSYALTLDTSGKIAAQLTQIQIDNLGIDYIQRRSSLIDAVTIEDAKKAARRLYGAGMLVTVAGRPKACLERDYGIAVALFSLRPAREFRQITAWASFNPSTMRARKTSAHTASKRMH